MKTRLPISVCMMCLNEGAFLPGSLQQIEQFAEWIVVDTGSSDDTVEVAKRLGATVVSERWHGFSETRRKHFEMASQKWILWIDGDEIITPEIVAELRTLFENGDPPLGGYRLSRVMMFEGEWIRYGDWYRDRVLRLFRKDAWSMEKREVHESVSVKGPVGTIVSELPHFSYEDWRDRSERIATYAKLWAVQERAKGRKSSALSAALRSAWRFICGYFLKGGIFGGVLGARIAASCAKEVWLKYAALAELTKPVSFTRHHHA